MPVRVIRKSDLTGSSRHVQNEFYETDRFQRGLLEAGDLGEALRGAAAMDDDALQRRSTGTVRPESFSHGTSQQRARWFRVGFERGDPKACDTF